MYENTFSYNFIVNFLFGFFFIISNILFSICVAKNKTIKRFYFFKEFQSIIVFLLIFCLYTFVLNIIVLSNYKNLSVVIFSIFFIQILYIFKNLSHLKPLIHLNFKIDEKIILLVFFTLYLISILPMSDADSMSIYQYLPITIYNEGLHQINIVQNLEFTLLSNTETILLLSSIFKSDNLGAQLNLISLVFFILINFKKHKNFSLLILSSPLIIYFISTQKLQLFFGLMYLLLFILINRDLIKKKVELFIFILLLVFYSSGKFSYILFAIPMYFYFFYKNLIHWKYIVLYSLLSFVVVYVPILTIKQIYFNNIFAPFFENLLGQGIESYNAFVFSIRSYEGWLTNPSDFSLYLRPFVSFELSKISSSLGLIFLFMVFNLKLQKDTKYFPFIIIILVLLTGQILPRYYFEAFLLLSFFYKPGNFFIKLLIYSQILILFSISIIYIFISYIKLDVVKNKLNYMDKFTYSFFNSRQLNDSDLNGNVLDYSLDRHSVFFDKNVYSIRYLTVLNQYNNNKESNFMTFIDENSIDYFIVRSTDQLPKCILTKEIGKTFRQKAVRNFLSKPADRVEFIILEIKDNKCTKINK
jgi:hypothetical protein